MADESHLSLLKQGANAWNEWRHEHRRDQADLSEADLHGANLSKADLNWANLSKANLSEADLRRANLYKADLSGADLRRSNLSGADLRGADLGRADLSGADFSRANLSRADLSMAYLIGANLSGANLTGATLRNACLDGANFERATVSHTIFASVDLTSCTGLDSANHVGPSTMGIDSIILSKGRIPKIFLRGVGLPDEWIDYIPSLVGDGIQFFSCFISYSSLDKPFATRLHDVLQSKGIRCWLDEKQLLPGDDISRELERGIHLWDKFLLCASKNSLTSWWVEDEIKTTLEKERALRNERGKPVHKLIPLDLDGYMFNGQWDLGVLATEIKSRVVANFRDWEKPSSTFDKQVDRVIRALRADEGAREPPPPSRL
jgi:hypothetical protein